MEQITQISQVFRTSLDQRSWVLARYSKIFSKLSNGSYKNVFLQVYPTNKREREMVPFYQELKNQA
jgi:hypothetical protein